MTSVEPVESYTIIEINSDHEIEVTASYTVVEVNGGVSVVDLGSIGPQGPQGPQGPAGSGTGGGAQGPQGAQGAQGVQGSQGAQGAQGPQGAIGAQGAEGAQGSQGPQGAQGGQGAIGPQGLQGAQGVQGAQGATGPQGATGAQGAQGSTGTQGPQGETGSQGAQGDMGAQGAQGAQGATGAQGLQGAQGNQGGQGNQGAQGLQGSQGAEGAQGAQGGVGTQGPQGPQGAQGAQGPQPTAAVTGPQSSTDNAIVRWDGTSGTIIQNSTATLSDSGLLDTTSATLDYFQIDTAATAPTIVEGTAAWDGAEGTLELGLKGGNVTAMLGQQLYARVRNAETTALQKGEVVYLSSASGNRAEVRRASNTADTTSNKTLGIVSETIASNQIGFVITQGVQAGLSLGAPWIDGDIAWLGATSGTITRTKPVAPNHLVFVGIVERANAGDGQLFVKVQNGYELDEIHDVLITSPASGQTLIYDAPAGVWENASLTAGNGIAIDNGAGNITVRLADGDRGDVTVSGSGATITIDSDAVTYAKIQNVTTTDRVLGRSSAGAGDIEELICTAAGRALLDDADAAAQRTTLGAAAASHTHAAADITSGTIATARLGSNTANGTTYLRGDQTWATISQPKSTTLGVIYDQFVPQATASWNAVEYSPSLGLWCVVGSTGTRRVVTSSDGKTWTLRTESQTNSWRGIAWAPSLSLFAAVSSDGTNRVMTSPDGINWTNRSAAAANAWRDVAWSPSLSLFAAVSDTGTGNRIMTSPDGITWTSRTSAADSTWRRIRWISELSLFVAVGLGLTTNSIMTSADGITWTARTTPNTTYSDLVYFPEASVLVVSDSADTLNAGGILTSSDGLTYTQGSLNMKDTSGRIFGIEYISSAKCIVFGYYDGVTTLLERAGRAFTITGGNSHRLGKAVDLNRLKYASTPDLIVGITNTAGIFISGLG